MYFILSKIFFHAWVIFKIVIIINIFLDWASQRVFCYFFSWKSRKFIVWIFNIFKIKSVVISTIFLRLGYKFLSFFLIFLIFQSFLFFLSFPFIFLPFFLFFIFSLFFFLRGFSNHFLSLVVLSFYLCSNLLNNFSVSDLSNTRVKCNQICTGKYKV